MNQKELHLLQLAQKFLSETYYKEMVFIPQGLRNGSLISGILASEEDFKQMEVDPLSTPHAFLMFPLSWVPKDNSPIIKPGEALGVRIIRTEDMETGDVTLVFKKTDVTELATSLQIGSDMVEKMMAENPPSQQEN